MVGKLVTKVAFGTGARIAGGAAASALGSAVSGAFGLVTGLGRAAAGLAQAASSASDAAKEKQDSPSNVVYVNFGMAGTAAKQRVTGSGTLPGRSSAASPQVSEKMPTEALLDTAVKYLISIDKSLKTQLELEKRSFEQQTRDAREASIENTSSFSFSDIRDRFSELKASTKENVGFAGTLAKYALILGGAAALIATTLDQTQLNALKENIDQFKQRFGWLAEIGAAVGAGGLMGFLFGGKGVVGRLKGGLVGMVAGHVIDRLTGFFSGNVQTDAQGNPVIDPQTGEPVRESRAMSPLGMGLSVAAGAISANYLVSGISAMRARRASASTLRGVVATGSIRDLRASNLKGTSWLQSRRGRRFAAILAKRLGRKMYAQIAKFLARIVASVLLTATGVGAIVGIVGILVNVAFLAFSLYDIATAIWDAWVESADEETGANVAEAAALNAAGDATSVSPTADAVRITGAPVASESQLQNLPPIPADIEKILAALRTNESSGNYGENSVKPGSTASGAYQFLDSTWKARAAAAGVGTEYPRAYLAPPEIQDAVAAKYVQDILAMPEVNGDVRKVPLVWFTGNPEGNIDAYAQSVNAVTPAQVQAKFMQTYDGGRFAQSTYNPTAGAAGGLGGMATASLETVGKMLGALGGIFVRPGVARTFEPPASSPVDRINETSMRTQNDMTMGVSEAQRQRTITSPTVPASTPATGPVRSISHLNPNYRNIDSLELYRAHGVKWAAA